MTFQPRVSILIPCYNAERWIFQCIESALNQTYPHKEVIVVDDGSTDGSLDIIKSFGDKIFWESGPNRGGNVARNRLLELSSGEWLQYLDADDYLLPDKVNQQIQFLQQVNSSDTIYSPHITEELGKEGKTIQYPHIITNIPEPHNLWLLVIRWQMPQTGGLLFRKQSLIDIGGWREDLKHCQDYDLYIRLIIANKRFSYFNYPAAVYRWWCSGTITYRNILEIYYDRLELQDIIEEYLLSIGQLDQVRQDAINQARFEYARRVYPLNKDWAIKIISVLRQKSPSFEPSTNIVPQPYQLLYKIFGFTGAEYIAQIRRNLWKLYLFSFGSPENRVKSVRL